VPELKKLSTIRENSYLARNHGQSADDVPGAAGFTGAAFCPSSRGSVASRMSLPGRKDGPQESL
jgi:hypothetical protein